MAYIGIGYSGNDPTFLRNQIDKHNKWLKGDRVPRLFGDHFLILYDSNTAREFAKKCIEEAAAASITIFPMDSPLKW